MRRNGEDGDLVFAGAVAPENAIRAGGAILGVGFEDFLFGVVRVLDGVVFVGLEAGVAGIGGEKFNAFLDLLE